MRRLGLIATIALVLVVPAGATTASGLRGLVTRGPVTPVCREGTSCDAPAKNVTLTFTRNGVSRSVTTGTDGRYLIHLSAGTWSLRIASAAKFGYKPQTAVVHAGVVRVLNISIDTGIR